MEAIKGMCGPHHPIVLRGAILVVLISLLFSLTRTTLAIPIERWAYFFEGPLINNTGYVVLCGLTNQCETCGGCSVVLHAHQGKTFFSCPICC
jgi:hypothetical protein